MILVFVALFAVLLFVSVGYASETPLVEEWNKTFGGTGYDTANSVQQTSDGGYILAGSTLSYGDYWNMLLVKTDSDGNKQWDRIMWGRPETDMMIECVQQTSDGGYILAGGISVGNRPWDFWLVKTDSNGNLQWNQSIGKIAKDDFAYSVQQTSDGGYILAGKSNALGDTPSDYDFRLVKTDSAGMPLWDRYIDAGNTEVAYSVQQTSDGGYILAGSTYGGFRSDALLVKTYSNGKVNWSRTFGGTDRDMAYSVRQTSDGGYILAGFTDSYGAGSFDFWLVKTDSNGDEQWNKTFGGIGSEKAKSVWQTSDGGYILAGYTTSYGSGSTDAWLVKTDLNGNEQWNKTFGGTRSDRANSVQQTADGNYILAGETHSYGAGSADVWLIKAGAEEVNQLPVSDPNGPYTGTEGVAMTFDGSGSYDPDGTIVSYAWDFGDGNTSTVVNPTHTYAQNGTYTVTLTVTDNEGATDTNTTTATIADTEPNADFTGTPTSGPEPLTVTFTDASTSYDGIVAWAWDFGDGNTSTEQNPTHVYAEAGLYTVNLTVYEADGDSDTETKVDYINVSEVLQSELCPDEYRWNTSINPKGYEWDPFPTLFRAWNDVHFVNNGTGDAYNVIATITCAPVNVNIIDGNVTLGDIPAGGSAWSKDFFLLEVDMTNPQGPDKGICWRVEYDDAAGVHHVIENVPKFCGENCSDICP